MMTQRQLDFFHNILRVFVTHDMDDYITERFNRLLKRRDLGGLFPGCEKIESLFPEFHIQAKRRNITNPSQCDFWCAYIEALLESGDVDVADKYFRELIKLDWGMSSVASYLSLLNYAYQIGIRDGIALRGNAVFSVIKSSSSNCVFESIVSLGKSVALVGNGPGDNQKGLGREIDEHDVVIRINNYAQSGYERDFGSKTDVWVKASFRNIDHNHSRYPLKLIFYADELTRNKMFPGYLDAMYDELNHVPIECFKPGFRRNITHHYCVRPTTGFTLIQWIRRLRVRYLDVYGFSFLDAFPAKKYLSFDGAAPDASDHNLLDERVALSALPWDGRRLWFES